MYDVIVIGAGPAGNIAALQLSANGHRVAVVDWRHDIGDKLCTGIVGTECVKRFPPNDRHILRETRSATIVSPAGKRYSITKDKPQALIIDRVAYVGAMAEKAAAAGAEYILGPRVTNIETTDNGAHVTTTAAGNSLLSANLILLTSGFGSPLLKAVGLQNSKRNEFMSGAQAEVLVDDVDETEVYLGRDIAPGSFGWLVPLNDSRALAGVVSHNQLNGHMDHFLSNLQTQRKVREVIKGPSRWGVPLKPVPRTYGERVLVAGDAAGLAKPTTGGGIYYALLSGELAAETAVEAHSTGDFSAGGLKQYEKRWKSVFGRELKIGYYARLLYEALGDEQIERLLDELWTSGLKDELISPEEFSFDWHGQVILNALNHRHLGAIFRSFGPLASPFVSWLTRTRLR